MRLLWIFALALTLVFAFVFQTVNADAFNKKGPKHKGGMSPRVNDDDPHKYHPSVVQDAAGPGGRGINRLPGGDVSPTHNHNRDRSSSSDSDGRGKSMHHGKKEKHKKQRKDKKKHHGNKHRAGGGKKHHE